MTCSTRSSSVKRRATTRSKGRPDGVHRRLLREPHDGATLDPMLHPMFLDQDVRLVGYRWSPRVHELKRFLARSGVRFHWFDLDIEGDVEVRRIVEEAGSTSRAFPT